MFYYKVFDWERAAARIKEVQPEVAVAGLIEDWDFTSGIIYRDGEILYRGNGGGYTYLASRWDIPALKLDDTTEECWILKQESGHNETQYFAKLSWPRESIDILFG